MTTIEVIENLDKLLHTELYPEKDDKLMGEWLELRDKLTKRINEISLDSIINLLCEKGWDFSVYHHYTDNYRRVTFRYKGNTIDTDKMGYDEILRVLTEDDDELTPFI